MNDKPMSIMEHLDALRKVVLVSIISLIPGTIAGWYLREEILQILIRPITKMHYKLVFLGATEAFTSYLKLSMMAGIIIASPVIAYKIWSFMLPALHKKEKKYIFIVLPFSVVLFIGGIVFAYFTIYNYAVQFLLSFGGEGLAPMLSMSKFLSFAMWFLLPFGLIFELPLVIVVLARLGLVQPHILARKRKWALLIIFIVAAIVTPTTDMITQTIMAAAVYLLFEVSIWLSYLTSPKTNTAPDTKHQQPMD